MEEKEQKPKIKRDRYPLIMAYLCGVITVLILAAGGLLLVRFFWKTGDSGNPDSIFSFGKTQAIMQLIQDKFVGDVDNESLSDSMYKGLIEGLGDKYSCYYTQEEYESIRETQQGHYKGIGISASMDGDAMLVQEVTKDSPAEKGGILVGDHIISINGTSLAGMTISEAVSLLRDSDADSAELVIQREGEEDDLVMDIELTELDSESVGSVMLENSVGYIRISSFTALTPDQFAENLQDMRDQGAEKLIIDLRNNPGGLVSSVTDTLRLILPEGLIVYTLDKQGKKTEYQCDGDSPLDLPLVVLVNENSASASEIFTGAVQDYGIGTIVGTTTYGKGIVQDVYQLEDGSVVKLTIAHYYTPKGNDIQGKGITPDVEVTLDSDATEDTQLLKALEVLEEK